MQIHVPVIVIYSVYTVCNAVQQLPKLVYSKSSSTQTHSYTHFVLFLIQRVWKVLAGCMLKMVTVRWTLTELRWNQSAAPLWAQHGEVRVRYVKQVSKWEYILKPTVTHRDTLYKSVIQHY